jgi:TPR repeat protein
LNYVASYINLRVLSHQVSGTPKDYDAARRWYEKAVAANDPAGLNADAAPRAVREDRRRSALAGTSILLLTISVQHS